MKEVSVEDFKLFKEKVDNFITKDAETFYFRNLMEAIHDSDYMNEVTSIMEYVSKERTAKEIDELFQMLRAKAEGQFKLRDRTEEYEKKVDYSLRGLAYFCLVEALNENSSFSEKIIEDIKKKYGKDYLDIIKNIDRSYLSVDGKTILKEKKLQLPNDEEMKKYLVMKKWQDEQRLYSMKRIRPLYPLELEYIGEPDQNLMLIHKKTLVKRAKEDLKKMKIVPIEYLANLYEAGLEDELKDMIGGKALGLAKLRANGIKIPKTYVIPNGVEIEENEIKDLFDKNKKYAVRSSADTEDGGVHSFAGMFDSYLNVEKQDIIDRIKDVKKSLNNNRVKRYIQINNLKQPNMNVIIQEFIEPEISGVWIGKSEDDGILEWVEGNGEKLVSGKENPKREVWNRNENNQNGIRTNDYIGKQLLDIQSTLAKHNGDTADMEWCIINGELILLQYRPVTREISIKKNENLINSDDEIFIGSPASTGEVIGKAAYYRNLKDIKKWNDGDILISMFTDPDWLDIMSKSSGLVTAVGGMLCHSAIIARELGIPCVTGIGRKALKVLQNENEIYVNGTTGEVCSSRIYEKTKKKEKEVSRDDKSYKEDFEK
jgi:pyruvate,water dikinase